MMELQFKKNLCSCLNAVKREIQNLEETQEIRLSDGMPDIGRILASWGQPVMRSKEWRGDSIGLSGGIMVWVLYAPEDGTDPRCMESAGSDSGGQHSDRLSASECGCPVHICKKGDGACRNRGDGRGLCSDGSPDIYPGKNTGGCTASAKQLPGTPAKRGRGEDIPDGRGYHHACLHSPAGKDYLLYRPSCNCGSESIGQ